MNEKKKNIKKDLFSAIRNWKSNGKNTGITLIALVITIIILLILAGITISQLSNLGLFDKTRTAKEKYQNAQDDENDKIAKYENEIEDYINGNRNTNSKYDYLYELDQDSSYIISKNYNNDVSKYTRTLKYDVNNYDAVEVYFSHLNSGAISGSCKVDKKLFNKDIYSMLAYSTGTSYNIVAIKINSEDNRIQFEYHTHSDGQQVTINEVIGIKY